MENELTIGKENVLSLVTKKGVGDLLKPLSKEIFLFDSYVAGTTHLKDESVLDEIQAGDKLTLQRENNKFDENAILVLTSEKKKLGYVPEKDNIVFSRLMDAGKLLVARITGIEQKGTFRQVNIGIYLVDF
ncbi:restriction endonuclease [Butyrivibrio sp. CB08]|uniref:HIRAN domain-containing protein n=1 Tax=Butyrivibrio sp. CB08 TaxID=2364879 RepID=UPI000EA88FF2|nr:HIRAN domain-containing protein [Butyrivibrio sp. CB08]RKM56824.1 restriction endonuclease [Butyrivibrio sp. CB08]